MSSSINTVQEKLNKQRTMAAKVDSLETKLNACNSSLEWIISALICKDFIPENTSVMSEHRNVRNFYFNLFNQLIRLIGF